MFLDSSSNRTFTDTDLCDSYSEVWLSSLGYEGSGLINEPTEEHYGKCSFVTVSIFSSFILEQIALNALSGLSRP